MKSRRTRNAGRGLARPAVSAFVVLLACGALLTGCEASLVHTPRMSDAWSKGLPLGLASLNNPVAMAVDEAGSVYVVWSGLERDLRFVRLNERAGIEVDRALDLEVRSPQQPQMLLDPEGQLHLTWLDSRDGGLQLSYARLSAGGEVIQDSVALSNSELRAGRSTMALDPAGGTVEVFWSDTAASRPGCYHATVDRAAAVVTAEETLIPDGFRPSAQADAQGFVHLAWRVEPEVDDTKLYYAVYDPRGQVLGPITEIGEPLAQASLVGGPTAASTFDGPRIGLDGDQVYVAWVVEVRERGQRQAFTFYRAFPQPDLSQAAAAGAFDYPMPEVTARAVHVRAADPALTADPQFLVGQPERQVLVCSTQAVGPGNLEMLQSAAVDLQGGQIAGLEVVSATPGASMRPSVAADGQGYLHLVWIDTAGFERYRVVYASTAPGVQEVLNPVTVGEVVDQVLQASFSAVMLIGFLPLYLMWAIPAFLVMLVFYFASQEADLDQPLAFRGLVVAIVVHAVVKISTAGGVLARLGSGGLFESPVLYTIARWLVPLLITGLAVLLMRAYIRRSGTLSVFGSFLVFILSDAVLFSLVYLTPIMLLG